LLSAASRWLERKLPPSLRRCFVPALVILAALYTVSFLACASSRLPFRFELSWLESGNQAMVDRLAAHQPIYVEPSPTYIPFMYPPLYFVAAHGIARVLPWLGPFVPMRLVSSLATLAMALAVFLTLRRSTRLGVGGRLLVTALLFAFYGRYQFWFDTSRVDTLLACLVFVATALLIEGRSMATAVAAGCVGGMAILTKQPAMPLLIGAAVAAAPLARWRALVVVLTAAASACLGLVLLGEWGPWLYYYLVRVPATGAPYDWHTLVASTGYTLDTMPLFVISAAVVLVAARRGFLRGARVTSSEDERRDTRFTWALAFAIWLAVIFGLRLRDGATINIFVPILPIGLVVIAIGLGELGALAQPLLLAQYLILLYNPRVAIPTPADSQAGEQLLRSLARIQGDIYLPQFPSYLPMLGKSPVANGTALCDLAFLRPDLVETVRTQIDQGRYAAVVPWRAAEPAAACRPQNLQAPFKLLEEFPKGGPFFEDGHVTKVAGIYVFQPDSAKAPPSQPLYH
jgi:hypothetical protein